MNIVPADIPESNWKQLEPKKAYAMRCNDGDDVRLRFGPGGMFIAITGTSTGECVLNDVGLADGAYSVLGKINPGKKIILGRSSDSTISISHVVVSRKHLEVYSEGNVLVIKDLGSTNGTFCYTGSFFFDIEDYMSKHPNEKATESTMDAVHEAFGPTIDDFLKKYSELKNEEK